MYATSGNARDIAVGTRNAAGTGSVYNTQFNSNLQGTWSKQPFATSPTTNNIYSLKFSPNYNTDFTIAVIYFDTGTTSLRFNLGLHNTTSNTTSWNDATYGAGYPVNLNFGSLPTLIGTDLALPSDFSANVLTQQGCFASIQTDTAPPASSTRVYYINTSLFPNAFNITPSMTTVPTGRISSIAYKGSESSGILLAGEVFANPGRGLVNVWQSANAQSSTIGGATWTKSDDLKSPTGGAAPGGTNPTFLYRANSILNWSADGTYVYCATSSENAIAGGTGFAAGQWPVSKLTGVPVDESAFSRSSDSGITWNQIGLIDTQIDHLTDAAALEAGVTATATTTSATTTIFSSVLYLSTAENTTDNFTSVWRSTSDPLGNFWERILLRPKLSNNSILRINPRIDQHSTAVVFADVQAENITYSSDQGQTWQIIQAGTQVDDIALESDTKMYVLDDYTVRQVNRSDSGWVLGLKLNTNLDSAAHTIWSPLKSPTGTDIVLVGSDFQTSSVAWADFSQIIAKFTALKALPAKNSWVHVVSDSQYEQNQFIYAGVNVNTLPITNSSDGNIYRWQIGKSTDWDELDPPNLAFYGIDSVNSVLYGARNFSTTDLVNSGGVDRTLYPTVRVPPAPEWDDLTAGLPQIGKPNYPVQFNREPTSLKTSSNSYNTLWAIDNRPYRFDTANGIGCLWSFVDSLARIGPAPTSPPTGSYVGADPVSGRSQQIDFKWRPLSDVIGYDILLAKDVNFTLLLSQVLNLTPVDNKTGAWIVDTSGPAATIRLDISRDTGGWQALLLESESQPWDTDRRK